MMSLLATLLTEAPAASGGLFSGLGEYLGSITPDSLDFQSLGAGGTAALLAVVWYFLRIVRTLVSILFTLCLIFLALHLAGYADIPTIWETVSQWLSVVNS